MGERPSFPHSEGDALFLHIIGYAILALIALVIIRHRSTARSITRAADRNVWAQASEARFPHYPRRTRLFGRRRGLK